MICPKCGKEVNGNFCSNCGTSIVENNPVKIDDIEDVKTLKRKRIKTFIVFCVALGISILIYSIVNNLFNKSNITKPVEHDITSSDTIDTNTFQFGIPENIKFGMKESEVTNIAGEDYTEYDGLIKYGSNCFYGDIMYYTYYGFSSENKLCYISYQLDHRGTYKDGYDDYATYELLQETMTEQHGEYKNAKIDWYDERYKDDTPNWNKAFANGHCKAMTGWICENYSCVLKYDDVGVSVTYYDINTELPEITE